MQVGATRAGRKLRIRDQDQGHGRGYRGACTVLFYSNWPAQALRPPTRTPSVATPRETMTPLRVRPSRDPPATPFAMKPPGSIPTKEMGSEVPAASLAFKSVRPSDSAWMPG